MKIILTDNVTNLGKTGDVVNVADGYARNYLIPRSLAMIADEKNVKQINHKKRVLEHKLAKQLDELRDFAKKIEKVEVTLSRKAGENGKLFGSVTNQDIHHALEQAGIQVDRRSIVLSEPIKAVGAYTVVVKLGTDVEAKVKTWVVEDKTASKTEETTNS